MSTKSNIKGAFDSLLAAAASSTEGDSNNNTSTARSNTKKKRYKHSNKIPFPQKLFNILKNEDASIISWTTNGDAFIVRDNNRFVTDVLPRYFRSNKLIAFQRQLLYYGFCRITMGPNTGAYQHELFQRDKPNLCQQINRTSAAARDKKSDMAAEAPKRRGRPPKNLDDAQKKDYQISTDKGGVNNKNGIPILGTPRVGKLVESSKVYEGISTLKQQGTESILTITADKQIKAYLDSQPTTNTLKSEEEVTSISASTSSPNIATRTSNRIKVHAENEKLKSAEESPSPSPSKTATRSTRSSKKSKNASKKQPKRGNTYGIKHRKFKVDRDEPTGKDGLTKSQAEAIAKAFSRHDIPSELISSQYRYARNQSYENKARSSSTKPPPPVTNWDAQRLQEWEARASSTTNSSSPVASQPERKSSEWIRHWTKEEDDRIVAFAANGEEDEKGNKNLNWDALRLPGRDGEQAKKRWEDILDPNIKNGAWTVAEMKLLIDGQKELGNKWTEIAKRIPGRNDSSVKNRWYNSKTYEKKAKKKAAEEALSGSLEQEIAATTTTKKKSSCLPRSKEEGTRSFTREAEILLMKGMMKHGSKSWKKIYVNEPGLHHIKQSALKDRARNKHFQIKYERAKLDPSLLDRVDELYGAFDPCIYIDDTSSPSVTVDEHKEKVPKDNGKPKGEIVQPESNKIKSIAVPRLPQRMVVQPQKSTGSPQLSQEQEVTAGINTNSASLTTATPTSKASTKHSGAYSITKTGSQESVMNGNTSESLEGNFPLFYQTLKKQEEEMQLEGEMSAEKEESKVKEDDDEDVNEVLSALFSMKSRGVKFEDNERVEEEDDEKESDGEYGTTVAEYNNRLQCPYCSKRFASIAGRQYHIDNKVCQKTGYVSKSFPVDEKPVKSRPSQDTHLRILSQKSTNMLNNLFYNYHDSELEKQGKTAGGPMKSTSVYHGVHRDMSKKDNQPIKKFQARFDGTYLGSYSLETDAALAYDAAIRARRHTKHYGKVNFATKDSYLKERAVELKSKGVSLGLGGNTVNAELHWNEAQKHLEQILAFISSHVSIKIAPLDEEEEELASPKRQKKSRKPGAPKRKSSFEESYDYGDRFSKTNVNVRKHYDGSVSPAVAPRQLPDGLYQRPVGRGRIGCDWDAARGLWVPSSDLPKRAREDNAYAKSYKVVSKRSSASKSPVVSKDEKTVNFPMGVRQMVSGNFEVGISYQGKRRSVGTFNTLDDAVLANKVARGILKSESGQLSAEQTDRNIQSAKEAMKVAGVAGCRVGRPVDDRLSTASSKDEDKKQVVTASQAATRQLPDGLYQRPVGRARQGCDWDYSQGLWVPISGFEQSSTTEVKKQVVTASQIAPRQLPDGLYQRPVGRARQGCDWDYTKGLWVPISGFEQSLTEDEKLTSPKRKKRHSQAREDNAYTKTYKISKRASASKSPVVVSKDKKPVPVDMLFKGPRQLPDGTFARPRGKGRVGFDWDYSQGLWVPQASTAEEEVHTASQAKSILSGLFGK